MPKKKIINGDSNKPATFGHIEEFARMTHRAFEKVATKQVVNSVKQDVQGLTKDFHGLKQDIQDLKDKQDKLQDSQDDMKSDIEHLVRSVDKLVDANIPARVTRLEQHIGLTN